MATDNLTGALSPAVALSGGLVVTRSVAGKLAPVTGFSANLSIVGKDYFQGGLPISVVLAATLTSGPLWEPSTPPAPVDWEETELCGG